ncbi:antibiotic biosynthesis monooxygenase [Granulicella sp. dw_53]|uniref:antibiotic biosynthesis monooxygenase n=1 Tax=Granulicella sp. dw_53 TaxID=2719792 RepID=UPI00210779EF|nr:antibiotic biosynthesis monooxygenase [Granulicella sp. dw_53]
MKMICRAWRAEATNELADSYQNIALTKVIPSIEARKIHGFLHIDVLRRPLSQDKVEFMTLMWFDSAESIKAFVGEDSEASYLPTDITELLARYDLRAAHFEVVAQRPQKASAT